MTYRIRRPVPRVALPENPVSPWATAPCAATGNQSYDHRAMVCLPRVWRSPSARTRAAREQRQRELAALRRMAEAYDRRQAEKEPSK